LDARKVKAGDPILAKLALAWKSPSCDLRQGAIIQGHVVTQKAHSKTEKTSEIGVVFDAGQCGGPDMKPLFLTVAAVVAPSPARDSDFPYAENLQPLGTRTGNAPAAIQSFDPIHHSVQILAEGLITAPQLAQRP
jgi:hypothetical protein